MTAMLFLLIAGKIRCRLVQRPEPHELRRLEHRPVGADHGWDGGLYAGYRSGESCDRFGRLEAHPISGQDNLVARADTAA